MDSYSAQMGNEIMGCVETQKKGHTAEMAEDASLDASNQIDLKMKAMKIDSDISGNKNPNPVSLNNQATPMKGSAKAHLYEICSMNHWRPPLFECYKEEGPDHNKLFTFKVTVEIKQGSAIKELECHGNSQTSKKVAAENAAEGALWYLKQVGYQRKRK